MQLQKIGEEENFQHTKDDKQLDANDEPQRFPQFHMAETVIIQVEHFIKETRPPHGH